MLANCPQKKKPAPDASISAIRNALRPDGSSSGPLTMISLSDYRRKKNLARNTQIDKRCSRKLDLNVGWSDQTEVFHLFLLLINFTGGIFWNVVRCISMFQEPRHGRITKR